MSNKWTDEVVARLVDVVGEDTEVEVSLQTVGDLAEELDFSDRSVASKLRNMGYGVEKVSTVRVKSFSDEQESELVQFVQENSGKYTYAEIAASLFGDNVSARQVQGKLLSLDLLEHVKPTEHVEPEKKFTDKEETTFIQLANSGAFLEDISATLNKELNSVRGKALSLLRKGLIESIPKQRETKVTDTVDPIDQLENIESMSVADIAEALGKTERGVKTMLTKRGIKVSNYDGEKKAAKAAEKRAEAA